MKKQLPLILSTVVGLLALALFYIPAELSVETELLLTNWAQALAATALILGGINIVQVNYPKIRRRENDWPYKAVLLGSAAIMLLAGIPWHALMSEPESQVTVTAGVDADLAARDRALVIVDAGQRTLVSVDGQTPTPSVVDGQPARFEVLPGEHSLMVTAGTTDYFIGGYSKYETSFEVAAGQTAEVRAELMMLWGLTGRAFKWLYDHIFDPCNSTMFALLAFFIASAAFRAFRARNVEAALLLGAAILVMLGRVPIGRLIWDAFPYISDWLVEVPNNAGRRAIMMGAALGAVVTGLRVILGLERSHLGSD